MNDRPTPRRIIGWYHATEVKVDGTLAALAEHGYVIVHPDDVPRYTNAADDHHERNGWNACWDHIFAERSET